MKEKIVEVVKNLIEAESVDEYKENGEFGVARVGGNLTILDFRNDNIYREIADGVLVKIPIVPAGHYTNYQSVLREFIWGSNWTEAVFSGDYVQNVLKDKITLTSAETNKILQQFTEEMKEIIGRAGSKLLEISGKSTA